MTSLVYKKVVSVSKVNLADFTSGQIINLMSVDVDREEFLVVFFLYLCSFFWLIVATFMLLFLFLYIIHRISYFLNKLFRGNTCRKIEKKKQKKYSKVFFSGWSTSAPASTPPGASPSRNQTFSFRSSCCCCSHVSTVFSCFSFFLSVVLCIESLMVVQCDLGAAVPAGRDLVPGGAGLHADGPPR